MCFPIPDHDLFVLREFMRIEFFRSLAWLVLDEARDYFRSEISENDAAELAQRAGWSLPIIPSGSGNFKARLGANICWVA
jgi:hypothetical protein